MRARCLMSLLALLFLFSALSMSVAATSVRSLGEFGDISTPAAAAATLETAVQQLMEAGGGILEIPAEAPKELKVENLSQTDRNGHGVTIVDYRKGMVTYHLAPLGQEQGGVWAPFRLERYLNMGQQSLPHCGVHSNEGIHNYMISGASSYMLTLTEPAKKGKDARLYVDTIRGIWVGAYLNITGSEVGYAEPFDRVVVKSIGWDPEKRKNYFTADLEYDHPQYALVYNKHVVNGQQIEGWSNCDNQSMEFQVTRHHYAVGDSFVISGMMKYTGNVFSGFGDEGGVVINAETVGEVDGFHSRVEAVDWSTDTITYEAGVTNAHTLSNSRPLINYNRDKWITQGTVLVVPPGRTYQGKSYPSIIGGPHNVYNYQGGLILGSADCPWDESVIGRYFALTDDSEILTPNDPSPVGGYASAPNRPVYRWYEINGFERNPDGTKVIKILRVRWSAVAAGAPTLFDDDNYTWDGHERPLHYAIAPGAWVYDISQGWVNAISTGGWVGANEPRKIKVTPNGDRGSRFDFEVGDPIEQAIGSDPWHPRPIRIRQFDQIPTTMDNSTIEMEQLGRVQIPHAITISSMATSRNQIPQRKDKKPPYGTLLNLQSLAREGIRFGADVTDAAIFFAQPNDRAQPIRWRNDVNGSSQLTVDPHSGTFEFVNGDLNLNSRGLQGLRGLSGSEKPAMNLRGINVPVPEGAQELTVDFPTPESDAAYAVNITPTWLTAFCVAKKTEKGFTVQFATPAPAGASLDWVIVR